MFTFLVYVIDKALEILGTLGIIGFWGLLSQGEFTVVLVCLPLLLVGLGWGIITAPLSIAPRAYWAFSPLNVMGEKVGYVASSTFKVYLSPMIFLMCIYAV